MQRVRLYFFLVLITIVMSGCYHSASRHNDRQENGFNEEIIADTMINDTMAEDNCRGFYSNRHYSQNYNFVIKADSITLLRQQPEEWLSNLPTDSFSVKKGEHLVVADFKILNDDKTDSVWIQVARDQSTFGWIHESKLLQSVVPDDPISQFISTFSDTHLLIFLLIIVVIGISYLFRIILRKKANVVHFNDIDSFYPTLLAISVASAATFYSSIQLFAPDTWRHFYFHPSLNPFALPHILSIFITSVWAMIIMAIATIDDVYHKLPAAQATLYLWGLLAVCSVNYIVFSITTSYDVGYIILAAYVAFAIHRYMTNNFFLYVCGRCGAKMRHKGKCPKCGAENF